MCIASLARKSVSILIQKSSVGIDQLAGRLGGNCYFYHLGAEGVTQAFLFEKESYAEQFLISVKDFPEYISGSVDLYS
jgi:hypothetical protein